jgi:predicted O-methyltransferase YrrM
MTAMRRQSMKWHDDSHVSFGDVSFDLDIGDKLHTGRSTPDRFLLGKVRVMIEALLSRTAADAVRRMVEIGIYKGGSCAFFNECFAPEKLVAIDANPDPVAALDAYIATRNLAGVVRPFYGVQQADAPRLQAIVAAEFGDEPIDLVVDDASHLLDPTRASFNVLFPALRPGGLYVIEDWSWAHWPGKLWQHNEGWFKGQPALTNLVFEIIMAMATRHDLIEEVQCMPSMVFVRRGPGEIAPGKFDVAQLFLTRDRGWTPVL